MLFYGACLFFSVALFVAVFSTVIFLSTILGAVSTPRRAVTFLYIMNFDFYHSSPGVFQSCPLPFWGGAAMRGPLSLLKFYQIRVFYPLKGSNFTKFRLVLFFSFLSFLFFSFPARRCLRCHGLSTCPYHLLCIHRCLVSHICCYDHASAAMGFSHSESEVLPGLGDCILLSSHSTNPSLPLLASTLVSQTESTLVLPMWLSLAIID